MILLVVSGQCPSAAGEKAFGFFTQGVRLAAITVADSKALQELTPRFLMPSLIVERLWYLPFGHQHQSPFEGPRR